MIAERKTKFINVTRFSIFIVAIVIISVASYVRTTDTAAGLLQVILSIPSCFYVIFFILGVKDEYNKTKETKLKKLSRKACEDV
jgi:hypothetical protein